MNSNLRYFLEKHKAKIAIGIAAVIVLMILVVFVMFLMGDEEPIEIYHPKVKYASHYIVGKESAISLYDVAGSEIDTMSFDNIIYSQNRSNEMMIFADNEFLQITAAEFLNSNEEKPGKLQKASVLKQENLDVVSFVWNNDYIVIQCSNDSFAIYDKAAENFKYLSSVSEVDTYTLIGKYMIYTVGNTINSVNIVTERTVTIDVGAESYGFTQMGDKIVVFNKFGNGKNATTVFVLNPENLYIENVLVENTLSVSPISGEKPLFIRKANTLVLAEIQDTGKLNSITLNLKSGDTPFTPENTLYYQDYIYSLKDDSMMIISINGKYVEHTINISGLCFCPVYLTNK